MLRATLMASTPRLEGVGVHSGRSSWVTIHPATDVEIGSGIRFLSAADGISQQVSPASVISSARCTTIAVGQHKLSTVEHLMSALYGTGITDAVIEFDGEEVPILDGSASAFVEALLGVGIAKSDRELPVLVPDGCFEETIGNSAIFAFPSDRFSATAIIEYPDRPDIGTQAAFFDGVNYAAEVAPARTYGFLSELQALTAKGLATGASFKNCVALSDSGAADSRTPLRFENELARHKLLDVIGDLSLAGLDLKAHIVALRPSHAVNCSLALRFAKEYSKTLC